METPLRRSLADRILGKRVLFRRPIYIFWLSAITIVLFAATFGLNRVYAQRQQQLSVSWFRQGQTALAAGQPKVAIGDLRTALVYSHDNQEYLFALAQALAAANRIPEARAYLLSLLEIEPGSGRVNLELAHLAVKTKDNVHAMRYFNGAIYGAWEANPEEQRQQVRKELINFLISQQLETQARGELLTLSAEMPKDSESELWVANAFSKLGDEASALDFYSASLKENRHDADAQLGAGQAAFHLGRYREALAYFKRANAARPNRDSAQMLELTSLILDMNPFASSLPHDERRHRLVLAMDVADRRLQQCAQLQHVDLTVPGSNPLQLERAQWLQLDRQIAHARSNSSLVELLNPVASLIMGIEQQANCGAAALNDQAMLRIYSRPEELQP
jgi:tetratricopeptide (TPR) repeat protein